MVRIGTLGASMMALALSACGGPSDDGSPEAEATAPIFEAPAKPVAFASCAGCHAVEAGVNAIGPSLAGVVGRKAGSMPGYEYSQALKAYGKTWDEATLDTFLTSPMAAVPGTRMSYAGQPDPAARKAMIDYLKTLK